jgi:riboflavin synthase
MFTGIIERVGRLVSLKERGGGAILTVEHDPWETPVAVGESIAVQGACLTVTQCEPGRFTCDVLRETLERTNLGRLQAGARLNLERALRVGDRFGGHLVTGHVDGVGVVRRMEKAAPDWRLEIACSRELLGEIVPKGSIACDGVSLTVVALSADSFEVHIIPHTWNHTTLSNLRARDSVNVETDLVGKHVRRLVNPGGAAESSVTLDTLRRAGFVGPADD